MSISNKFSSFCTALRMTESTVLTISNRAKQITKRVNFDFRNIDSDIRYSLFVGSYGRGTDIHVSDIDMVIELPYSVYQKYDNYSGNGQSALIQSLKESIRGRLRKRKIKHAKRMLILSQCCIAEICSVIEHVFRVIETQHIGLLNMRTVFENVN